MSRYINTDALEVVGFTDQEGSFSDGVKWLLEYIDKLPSADVQPVQHGRWIPVSERLPESAEEDLEYPTVIVTLDNGYVTHACFYESTKEWGTGDDYNVACCPIAWMPLPEPYKESNDGK